MNKKLNLFVTFLALGMVVLMSCKKETPLTIPPEQAHFANQSTGSYEIAAPGVIYKIPIGITTVSDQARTVNVSVTSPTGAVQGTHYTLNKTSFVIPAGKVVDTLVVTGDYTKYNAGRKDTLVFTIQGADKGGVTASSYNDQFVLLMRGPCFGTDLNSATVLSMGGSYSNTRETNNAGGGAYGPYIATIKNLTVTSPTTASVKFGNLYDDGWGDVTGTLDWSDIANPKVIIPRQDVGKDYAAGQPLQVRNSTTIVSKFDYCTRTVNLVVDIIVNNYFGPGQAALLAGNYRINMK